jgi:formylglycine-generating enzyme required for sulfatase activity
MRTGWLLCLVLNLSLSAGEAPRSFPLWDGRETTAEYAARAHLPTTKALDLGGGVTLELVLIPAGQFIMGSEPPKKPTGNPPDAKEAARYATELAAFNDIPANEKPAHSVTLTQPFYMGKYTVTQAQYAAVMGTNPSHFKGAQLPVDSVSWDDATAFCSKLNETLHDKTLAVRLPTEAQWEYACRAGTRTRFYSGDADSDLDAVGWYESNSGNTTHPVGQKKPNAFGLYDMHGNVWQWCQDFYSENYSSSPIKDPLNDKGAAHVHRGGSWYLNGAGCRSAYRSSADGVYSVSTHAFRVIASPPPAF